MFTQVSSRPGRAKSLEALMAKAFVGFVAPFSGLEADIPDGWLPCYGQNVKRSDYPDLFSKLVITRPVTLTIATPAVASIAVGRPFSWNAAHPVSFRTTGALPTGIVSGTIYYVFATTGGGGLTDFRLTTTPYGTFVNTSGTQSGSHTLTYAPFGEGDGSTTFTLPDLRGCTIAGSDEMGGNQANRILGNDLVDGTRVGSIGGEETHANTLAELTAHVHSMLGHTHSPSGGGQFRTTTGGATSVNGTGSVANTATNMGQPSNANSGSAGGSGAHNNVQPGMVMNGMIFTGKYLQ